MFRWLLPSPWRHTELVAKSVANNNVSPHRVEAVSESAVRLSVQSATNMSPPAGSPAAGEREPIHIPALHPNGLRVSPRNGPREDPRESHRTLQCRCGLRMRRRRDAPPQRPARSARVRSCPHNCGAAGSAVLPPLHRCSRAILGTRIRRPIRIDGMFPSCTALWAALVDMPRSSAASSTVKVHGSSGGDGTSSLGNRPEVTAAPWAAHQVCRCRESGTRCNFRPVRRRGSDGFGRRGRSGEVERVG